MVYRVLPLFLVAVALMLVVSLPVSAQGQDKLPPNTHEGTVVSATGDKLIMRNKGEQQEHSHTLAPGAKVSLDGRDSKLQDLRPGMRIRVTTKAGEKTVAARIEALDKNPDFEKVQPKP
jgi:hypothetical protein